MMLIKPVKGIFFDICGTLNFNVAGHWIFPPITEGLINLDGIYYIPITKFSTAYDKCIKFIHSNHCIKTLDEEYELFKAFYTMLSEYLPELELTKEKIKLVAHDKVYNLQNDVFFDDVYETLESLSESYKLGIISNSWPSCEYKLKSAGLYDFFTCITLSCHLGTRNPDPCMFEHAIKSMGLPAGQTVFVDDEKENLALAEKFGIQPIFINTKCKMKDGSLPTINCLSEIMEYL